MALNCLEKDSQNRPDIFMIINKLNEIETGINEVINIIALLLHENFVL
jgi:hypothetical protein